MTTPTKRDVRAAVERLAGLDIPPQSEAQRLYQESERARHLALGEHQRSGSIVSAWVASQLRRHLRGAGVDVLSEGVGYQLNHGGPKYSEAPVMAAAHVVIYLPHGRDVRARLTVTCVASTFEDLEAWVEMTAARVRAYCEAE